jgi:hypothetical protein
MTPFDAATASMFNPATNEPIGQVIARDSTSRDYYTPWFFRRTEKATFGCEVITLPTDVSLTFLVQKKSRDETDAQATDGSSVSFTAGGSKKVRETGLEELVRYKITIAGSASVGHCTLRILQPSWEPH